MSSISIITATYNSAESLSDCIESVVNQDIKADHILIDGGSTDSTLDITNKYQDYLAHTVSESDKGIYDAINKGLKLAVGEVIGILNADDYYSNHDVLRNVVDIFNDSKIDACYGDLIYVDKIDKKKTVRYWRSGSFKHDKFYWGWMPPHPTFFVRRSVYEQYGYYRLDMGTSADYEIMLRFLLKHKIKVAYIPKVLVHMRIGGISNVSFANRLKANSMDREAWEINGIKPYPWTTLLKPIRKLPQWFVGLPKEE